LSAAGSEGLSKVHAMAGPHIVVVEDDRAIRRGIGDALRSSGYEVIEAADGVAGTEEALRLGVDLVLLDLLMPKRDGMEVLAQIRKVRPTLPVVILTARGTEDDRVQGLKKGADDYVVKPFSARELLARVEAVLRRSVDRPRPVRGAVLGETEIDFDRREVRRPGTRAVELSETEAAILSFLVEQRHRAVSRQELLSRVWGIGHRGIETRTIDMHIVRLRSKLKMGDDGDEPEAILTVRAQGYMAGPELRPLGEARKELA
jgi:DNA-binding response OmpR family regulator